MYRVSTCVFILLGIAGINSYAMEDRKQSEKEPHPTSAHDDGNLEARYPNSRFLPSATDEELKAWFLAAIDDAADVEKVVALIGNNSAEILKRFKFYAESIYAESVKGIPQKEVGEMFQHEFFDVILSNCDGVTFYALAMSTACALKIGGPDWDKRELERQQNELIAAGRRMFEEFTHFGGPDFERINAQQCIAWWTRAVHSSDFEVMYEALTQAGLQADSFFPKYVIAIFKKLRTHADWNGGSEKSLRQRALALEIAVRAYTELGEAEKAYDAWQELRDLISENGYGSCLNIIKTLNNVFLINKKTCLEAMDFFLERFPNSKMKSLIAIALVRNCCKGKDIDFLKRAISLTEEVIADPQCGADYAYEDELEDIMFCHSIGYLGYISYELTKDLAPESSLEQEHQEYIHDKIKSMFPIFTGGEFSSVSDKSDVWEASEPLNAHMAIKLIGRRLANWEARQSK